MRTKYSIDTVKEAGVETNCLLEVVCEWQRAKAQDQIDVYKRQTVDISYALKAGAAAVILIFGVLIFRMAGVFFCLLGTDINLSLIHI